MLKKLIFPMIAVLMIIVPCSAKEIGGIFLPDTLEFGQTKLILNGGGVREKFFIDVYVGALYLVQKNSDPENIINVDMPMVIRLHIVSNLIKSEQMEKATLEGFEKSTNGNMASIKPQIDRFISVFKDEIHLNDVYDLVYIPKEGVKVYKNNRFILLARGLSFKQALFGIWLCDKPVQENLKLEMLGK